MWTRRDVSGAKRLFHDATRGLERDACDPESLTSIITEIF